MEEIMDKKGFFTFTGNPFVDNGMAVLANIAEKDNFNDITPNDIIQNIDSFFEDIKYQYNDENADENDKKHSKKKLKQHLTALYTTNHYLHGINNFIFKDNYIFKVVVKNENEKKNSSVEISNFEKKISKSNITFSKILNSQKLEEEVGKIKKYFEQDLKISSKKYTIKYEKKLESVVTNKEYFNSFKEEVIKILNSESTTLTNNKRIEKNSYCNFCGKPSDIKLSKDIFPLASPMDDLNLGILHSCKYCYLAILFYYFNLINFKKDQKGSGMYFFYHFSHPKVMIEYSKLQIKKLQEEKLSSLQTIIGGKYNSVFNDLYEKMAVLTSIKQYQPSVTIYFLLNDNRGAVYENISIPNGLLKFWISLNSFEGKNEWSHLHSQINNTDEYQKFIEGNLSIKKFKNNKKETLITYLKEVALMKEDLIKICEDLSENLIAYFKEWYQRKSKKREHWTEEFYDYFNLNKSYDFFNNLLTMNNEYFRWTGGNNLLSISSIKLILEDFKKYNLFYGLIEYLILNNMENEDKERYLAYYNKKTNQKEN